MILKTVDKIENLKGKKVLLRLDLNISLTDGEMGEEYRLERSLKTLKYLRDNGARVIIISHVGSNGEKSLAPIAKHLKIPIFDLNIDDDLKKKTNIMSSGDVVMLENLRKDEREKKNDESFARELSTLADVFVNEAFSASHREHASIVGVPKFLPSYFGFLFQEEVKSLFVVFNAEHPFVFVLGGAKLETKLPLIEKFLGIADEIFIGGATANSILKNEGYEVGASLVDKINFDIKNITKNTKIILPDDFIVKNSLACYIKKINEIKKDDNIVDVGHDFVGKISSSILKAKFVLWNGPLGFYEEGYDHATSDVAKIIALSNAKSVVGGGDTVSVIKKMDIMGRFGFVSTGGGAMLDFLAKGTLPGIEAIMKKNF